MPRPTLNWSLLQEIKRAFVPMPAGQGQPVAGAGPMTDGLTSPMAGDPAAAGMDPAMAGMDPAMMGMDPAMAGMDPAMAGGDPAAMAGMDPAMAGMDPAAMAGGDPALGAPPSQISFTMTVPEFIDFLSAVRGQGAGDAGTGKKAKSGKADVGLKLDHLMSAMGIQPPDAGGGDGGEVAQ